MNLERILAENMIRFGTRNLTEKQVKKILMEQLQSLKPLTITTLPAALQLISNPGPLLKRAIQQISQQISANKIPFSTENAGAYLAIWYSTWSLVKKQRKLNKMTPDALSKEIENELSGNMPRAWEDITEIQLNESKDDPGKALTVGVITKTGINGNDRGSASDVLDIITFCNDYNLGELLATIGGSNPPYDQISMEPMQIKGNQITGGSFIVGTNGQPGVGSLDLDNALTSNTYDVFYSQAIYKAGSGISAGTTTTLVYTVVGDETVATLPKNLFETGKIQLAPGMSDTIKTSIENIKKLGTIVSLRIESGASYDRPVKSPNADAFAKMVGVNVDKVPTNPSVENKEGIVTDPLSGGNAFLAIYRGNALASAIGNLAGVTPTIVAKVEKGGDAAQYAKLYYTIKKADDTNTVTQDDLKNLNTGASTTALAGQFKIAKFSGFGS